MKQRQKIGYVYKKVGDTQILGKVRRDRFQITVMRIDYEKQQQMRASVIMSQRLR